MNTSDLHSYAMMNAYGVSLIHLSQAEDREVAIRFGEQAPKILNKLLKHVVRGVVNKRGIPYLAPRVTAQDMEYVRGSKIAQEELEAAIVGIPGSSKKVRVTYSAGYSGTSFTTPRGGIRRGGRTWAFLRSQKHGECFECEVEGTLQVQNKQNCY